MADLIALQLIAAPNRGFDFGHIDDATASAIGRPAGPIRLQYGYPGPKGFGDRHIQTYPQRLKQFEGLGYRSFSQFVFDVAQNYEIVQAGEAARLVLVYPKTGYDLRIIVDEANLNNETFWTVVTGIPSRVARGTELTRVSRTGGSELTPDDAVRPRFATLSLPKKP